jgi:hypothetical protein
VEKLSRVGEHFVIRAGARELEAAQVVVAMANYQRIRVPDFARELDASIVQLHMVHGVGRDAARISDAIAARNAPVRSRIDSKVA